jgi:signal transduction histidine kinase
MTEMIQDLLQFSRSGSIQLSPIDVDLTDISWKVMQWIRQDNPDREIDVHIQEDMKVRGDYSLLMVVMKNLLGNAWKFTSRTNGPSLQVSLKKEEGMVVIRVKDNGAGFDPSLANNLFSPFVRLHSQDVFPGTGVGLTTVRRIIERHGGRIWAEGKVGKGATFSFSLPV